MAFIESGLCLAAASDKFASLGVLDNLTTETTAGVYVIVGCEGDSVSTLYVGQSWHILQRMVQHRNCYEDRAVLAEKQRPLSTIAPKDLTRCSTSGWHTKYEEKAVRTMVEGLWCLTLGSYQHKKVWMILRRRFGLPNVGEQVLGGNCKSPVGVEGCWADFVV
jgi:hypothetical protein